MGYDYYYYNEFDIAEMIFDFFAGFWLVGLAVIALMIVGLWKLFDKAGEPGWASVVPFYNVYTLFKITWDSGWFFLLLCIPFCNAVIWIITMVKLSKAFGKGGGWACGLIFLPYVFFPITGFSKDFQYVGKNGANGPGGYGGGGGYPGGGGGGGGGAYQDPYKRQEPEFRQETQGSPSNDQYRYVKTEPQGGAPSAGGYCPACGAKVEAGSKFCAVCGKQL
jgi:hypothetical protein